MANRANFGAPSVGGGKYKNHKFTNGVNRYRIGPPFKSLAASGRWFSFLKQHFGYRTPGNEQNPNGFLRTFVCPQEKDNRTEMVRVPCAECDERDHVQGIVDAREAQMTEQGKTKEQIDAVVGPQKEWLKMHNLDKKYNVLAKNEKNEWGVLPLPYSVKQGIDTRRKKVQAEEGIDILAIENGAWLEITREGEGFKTEYTVDVVYEIETINGRKVKSIKLDTLTDADFDSIEATCPDLTTIGTVLTQEQIARLVESGGDPEIVEAIFNEGRQARETSASPKAAPEVKPNKIVRALKETVEAETKVEKKEAETEVFVQKKETLDPAPKEETGEVDEEAKLLAQLAAVKAKKIALAESQARAAKLEAKAETKPHPDISQLEQLSDEELISVLRPKAKR